MGGGPVRGTGKKRGNARPGRGRHSAFGPPAVSKPNGLVHSSAKPYQFRDGAGYVSQLPSLVCTRYTVFGPRACARVRAFRPSRDHASSAGRATTSKHASAISSAAGMHAFSRRALYGSGASRPATIANRRIQMVKGLLLHDAEQLGAPSAAARRLVRDDEAAGLAHAREDRLLVEWPQGALLSPANAACGLEGLVHHVGRGDHRDLPRRRVSTRRLSERAAEGVWSAGSRSLGLATHIAPRPPERRHPERHLVVSLGDGRTRQLVEVLVLEEDERVRVADRREEEPLGRRQLVVLFVINSIPHSLRGRTTPSVQTAGAGAAASVDLACAVTRALIFNEEPGRRHHYQPRCTSSAQRAANQLA